MQGYDISRRMMLGGLAASALAGVARAQGEEPQPGGTLIFSVQGEPDTYDCHASFSISTLHRLAPHYALLVKIDTARYPQVVGDTAESWTVAPDGLTYTFRLKPDVTFHDGSTLTAEDVRASFERMRNPPAGVVSIRRALFEDIAAIEAPDARTVVFRLSKPNAAMLTIIASPWNTLYSAQLLASRPDYPSRHVMGAGPFRFVEHVPGSHWVGRRFERYHKQGQPFLEGFRIIDVSGTAMVNALAGGQTMADFRGLSPAERDRVVATRGDRVRMLETPQTAMQMLSFNTQRPPFDDARVRRALSLAIDRWGGVGPISRLTILGYVGGMLRPGYALARGEQELATLPGFARDIAACRAEARRLLAEAGVPSLSFTYTNRTIYTPLGIFLLDQWRQIGVTVRHEQLDTPPFFAARRDGNFEVIVDSSNEFIDEPSIQLARFISHDRAPLNISRYVDRTLDDLFERQARATDQAERVRPIREFETRMLTEAYTVPLFWGQRIIPIASELRGFTITPSYYLGQDLADLWLRR